MTSAGVVPTPAIAYLTRSDGYDAGVVISASHNPFEDNGIKVFSGRGEKFTETLERAGRGDRRRRVVAACAAARPPAVAQADLVDALSRAPARRCLPDGRRAARHRASRSTARTARRPPLRRALFRELGFDAGRRSGMQPDGRNINLHCGSTHPEVLARTVVERRHAGWASRSTATATAPSSSTTRARRRRRRRAADVRAAAAGAKAA